MSAFVICDLEFSFDIQFETFVEAGYSLLSSTHRGGLSFKPAFLNHSSQYRVHHHHHRSFKQRARRF